VDEEQKKSEEIFILMNLGKMTVTEIKTLTDKERFFLSKCFMEKVKNEEQIYKKTDYYEISKSKLKCF
jgi:hypothetical protein